MRPIFTVFDAGFHQPRDRGIELSFVVDDHGLRGLVADHADQPEVEMADPVQCSLPVSPDLLFSLEPVGPCDPRCHGAAKDRVLREAGKDSLSVTPVPGIDPFLAVADHLLARQLCARPRSGDFARRIVAADAELIALRIAEIGPIVVGVVLGAQAWSALAGAAGLKRQGKDRIHGRPIRGQQRNHAAIGGRGRATVIGPTYDQERPGRIGRLPRRPADNRIGKAGTPPQPLEDRPVEGFGPGKVVGSKIDMREHQ